MLHGVIDRVDRDPSGNLRVIDYKSGGTKFYKSDLQLGLAMQTALYALVAEVNWLTQQGSVLESHYWHIPNRETSGSLIFSDGVRKHELAEAVFKQAMWCVTQVREGIFPSAPAKPTQRGGLCSSHCEYGGICRVTRQGIIKARRGGLV